MTDLVSSTPAPVSVEDDEPPARPRRTRLAGLLLPAAGVVAWEVLSRAGYLPPNWVPAPTYVLRTILTLGRAGELTGHVGATLARVTVGFVLGAALGTAFGAAAGASDGFHRVVDPTVQAFRAVPSMAWAPLFLLWLGIGESSKIALIAVGVFFPVYLNLASGIRHVDPKLVEVGVLLGYRGLGLVRRVLLPASLPSYLVGLRSGLGLGWMFVVAAEIVGASRGLGFLLVDGQTTSRPELIMASVVLFAALGKATDALLETASRRIVVWR